MTPCRSENSVSGRLILHSYCAGNAVSGQPFLHFASSESYSPPTYCFSKNQLVLMSLRLHPSPHSAYPVEFNHMNGPLKLLLRQTTLNSLSDTALRMCVQLCRADIQTYCFGLAASMGAFLLGAGAKGKRYSMPNARIMIHQPLGGASGQAVDIEIQAKEIMYHKANLNRIMSECTGQPIDKVLPPVRSIFYSSISGLQLFAWFRWTAETSSQKSGSAAALVPCFITLAARKCLCIFQTLRS